MPLVSTVPPPALSVTARFEVKPDRNCKVPPPNERVPELLPRLLSADTASVPALIVVPPEYVFAPDSVRVAAPALVMDPVPEITFDSVASFDWLNVSDPVTSMLPTTLEPDCSVNVLAPPVNVMALARVTPLPERPPAIVPLLMMVSPEPTMPAPPAPLAPFPVVPVPPAPPLPPLIVPLLVMVMPEPARPAPPPPPAPPLAELCPGAAPPAPPVPPVMVPVFTSEFAVPVKSSPIPPLPPPPPAPPPLLGPVPPPLPPLPALPPASVTLLVRDRPLPVTTAP